MPFKQKMPRNAARTRQRLLKAAIRLFAEHGYHGVAVDKIVMAARVNKRMVYHYFGSKNGLFQAAFREVYDRLGSVEFYAIERGHSPREKLTRLVEGYFQFLDGDPVYTRFLLWANVEKGRYIGKEEKVLTKAHFFEQFRLIVEDGVRTGEFNHDLNIQQLLVHLIGLCFIYHSNQYTLSEGLGIDLGSREVKAEGLNQVIRLVFEGITPRPQAAAAPGAAKDNAQKPLPDSPTQSEGTAP
jgi:TetR/AcrR family transcriptional regulator